MQEQNFLSYDSSGATCRAGHPSWDIRQSLKTRAPEPSEPRTETLEHGTNECNHTRIVNAGNRNNRKIKPNTMIPIRLPPVPAAAPGPGPQPPTTRGCSSAAEASRHPCTPVPFCRPASDLHRLRNLRASARSLPHDHRETLPFHCSRLGQARLRCIRDGIHP